MAAPTVSIPDFKNDVGYIPWWNARVSTQLADTLANELSGTGGLQVVERQNLQAILSEQELAQMGIVKPSEESAKTGQVTGAQYIIMGRVSSYEEGVEEKENNKGNSFLGFGNRKSSFETKAYIAIDLRVVDSTTGKIIGFRTVEGMAKNISESKQRDGSLGPLAGIVGMATDASGVGGAALDVAGTYSFSEESLETKKTPVGKAIRAALIEASNYVDCILVKQNECIEEYAVKDSRRRQNTLDVLELN